MKPLRLRENKLDQCLIAVMVGWWLKLALYTTLCFSKQASQPITMKKSGGPGWAHSCIATYHWKGIHIGSNSIQNQGIWGGVRCRRRPSFKDREDMGVTLTHACPPTIDSCPALQSETEGKMQGLFGSQSRGGWGEEGRDSSPGTTLPRLEFHFSPGHSHWPWASFFNLSKPPFFIWKRGNKILPVS